MSELSKSARSLATGLTVLYCTVRTVPFQSPAGREEKISPNFLHIHPTHTTNQHHDMHCVQRHPSILFAATTKLKMKTQIKDGQLVFSPEAEENTGPGFVLSWMYGDGAQGASRIGLFADAS